MTEEYEMCECCGKNPGITNSMYWKENEEDDLGYWVCYDCEIEFELDHEEWAKSIYGDPEKTNEVRQ